MESKQPSSLLYILPGAVAIGASFIIIYILFASGVFRDADAEHTNLLLIGIIYGISIFSIMVLLVRRHEGPERARAMQSHLMLTIANETLSHLRHGFNAETSAKVAEIIFKSSDVDAVAITNNRTILAFAGFAREHHLPGSFLRARVEEPHENDELIIFRSNSDAGCPEDGEISWVGVSVPLTVAGETTGALEFLYLAPKKITENRIAVARGLGELLSTQLELSELEKQQALAVSSELKALRAQINPHFLFNTLNTIAALTRTDPQAARRLIINFADFFRESLERQSQFTTLDEELRYVNSYLVFEKARFGAMLQVEKHIDKSARRITLPSLVVQPLVENAIKHGMAGSGRLHLMLSAKVDDSHLVVEVRDDGVGMAADGDSQVVSGRGKGLGIGLTNVRERLRSLYGSTSLLSISSTLGEGTAVTLKIPITGGNE